MKIQALIYILLLWSLSCTEAQYIAELLDYRPAPGQLINVSPWGTPAGARSIEGGVKGTLSLGAFGGYAVFRFEQAVENDPRNPYGVDFTIFGNPMPDWSEPAVVWVMKDENANGKADDTWFELAGSDFWFSGTRKKYRVTYSNPGGSTAVDVPWEDQWGNSGIIRANSMYAQTYYPLHDSFPDIDPDHYTLEGTLLEGQVFEHASGISSVQRAFGYADNQVRGAEPYTVPDNPYTREVENSGGDAFDIAWAVDSSGSYVDLDQVHFIRVQSGLLADGGRLGELSTELSGAVDIAPDNTLTGETDMVVIGDLPPTLEVNEYQLEVAVFRQGRIDPEETVQWTTSLVGAWIDENNILRISEEGPLTITAALRDRSEIRASVTTTVLLGQTGTNMFSGKHAILYPNPTSGYFSLKDCHGLPLSIYDASGRPLLRIEEYAEGMVVDISSFPSGIYPVRIKKGRALQWVKLVKR